jgi:hypothetical protein
MRARGVLLLWLAVGAATAGGANAGAPDAGGTTAGGANAVTTTASGANAGAASSTAAPDAPEPAIAPFAAHYTADWKSINVGTSDIMLRPDATPGSYVYTWTMTARGIFRIVYSDDVVQRSWIRVLAGHVRPEKYRADQGEANVNIDFDWNGGRARGSSEGKPVSLKLVGGTQDVMSIQIEVMRDLETGELPAMFRILDKDEVKEFIYTREGTARIRTALGELDTVVVSSRRAGNNRVLRMWFAPSLGYIPVQAERSRDGKVEFGMRIKSVQR